MDEPKIFMFTIGPESDVSPELAPHLDVVELWPLQNSVKVEIARSELVPAALTACGKNPEQIRLTDEAILALVKGFTAEPGVFELSFVIRKLISQISYKLDPVRLALQKNIIQT